MAQSFERGERLLLLLSPEESAAVEEFRRKHRLSSRSEAVHVILRRSLGVDEKAPAPALPVVKSAGGAMPMTKPMTKPWHRAKRRSLNDL